MPPAVHRSAPPWRIGLATLPFGLFSGFNLVALPLLLTSRGMPLDQVGTRVLAWTLIPPFTSFLLVPLVDSVLPRMHWALLWAFGLLVSSLAAVQLLDPAAHGHPAPLAAVVFAGTMLAQLYSSTVGGIVPNVVDRSRNAEMGTWLNLGNLGGIGLGGTLAIAAVQRLGPTLGGSLFALAVALPALFLLGAAREDRTPRPFLTTARGLFRDLWAVSRTRPALLGLLIFVTPAATFAGFNLFSGLGRDFGASDALTTAITGVGSSVVTGLGCILGGWLSNRFDRRVLFVLSGVVASLGTLGMAFGPRVPATFALGVGWYLLLSGVNYTSCSAAAFDILGEQNPLSATQYALLMAAANLAIWTVTESDSHGFRAHGPRGLLLTDALFSLLFGSVLLLVLNRFRRRSRT